MTEWQAKVKIHSAWSVTVLLIAVLAAVTVMVVTW